MDRLVSRSLANEWALKIDRGVVIPWSSGDSSKYTLRISDARIV